jgi:hypothetical protein
MDSAHAERLARFVVYLICAAILLGTGVPLLSEGLVTWDIECVSGNFPQACSSTQVWQFLTPAIAGAILTVISMVFFVLAIQAKRASPSGDQGTASPPV